jgi:hypothetical protein
VTKKPEAFEVKNLLDILETARMPVDDAGFPCEPNVDQLRELTGRLIRLGVYPAETVSGNPNDVLTMVRGYGARWFEWREPLACPLCAVDLRDHRTGPPFKREIMNYDRDLDATLYYTCPDCKGIVTPARVLPNLAEPVVLTCIKSLYKSTYRRNAFTKGKAYELVREDDLVWIKDETGHEFNFVREKGSRGCYILAEYFRA